MSCNLWKVGGALDMCHVICGKWAEVWMCVLIVISGKWPGMSMSHVISVRWALIAVHHTCETWLYQSISQCVWQSNCQQHY